MKKAKDLASRLLHRDEDTAAEDSCSSAAAEGAEQSGAGKRKSQMALKEFSPTMGAVDPLAQTLQTPEMLAAATAHEQVHDYEDEPRPDDVAIII